MCVVFLCSEKARIRRAQEKEASRTALLARLDNKGLLGKEDAARLQEERAREERRRLAAEAAAEIAKKKSLQGKEPPPHSNDSAAGYHDFFDWMKIYYALFQHIFKQRI